MPECDVCGEGSFFCDSGHYYCSTCNTQVQSYIEEEVEVEDTLGGGSHKVRKKVEDKKDVSKDHGRPWVNAEGFTILLREQVDALIKLGAQPSLQDAVLRIWVAFLQKTKLAFTNSHFENIEDGDDAGITIDDDAEESSQNKSAEQKSNYNIRQRDLYLSTIDNPEVKNVRAIKNYKKRGKTRSQEQAQQAALMVSEFGAEEFYDEDNPIAVQERTLDVWDMIEEHDTQLLQSLEEKEGLEFRKLWNKRQKGPELMRVHTTLAMCYVGLLYTKHLVIAQDIVRWARDGLLPFNNGPSFFPPDLKLNDMDYRLFCCAFLPDAQKLENIAKKLTKYLELDPKPTTDLGQLICRFILELNLPGDLYHYAAVFLDHRKPDLAAYVRDKRPNSAAVAMAYVIFTLKLVFKLNDETEKELSDMTEKIRNILGPNSGVDLFSWTDWVKLQMKSHSLTKRKDDQNLVDYKQRNIEAPIKDFLDSVALKKVNKAIPSDKASSTDKLSKIFQKLEEKTEGIELTDIESTEPQTQPTNLEATDDPYDLDFMLSSQNVYLDPKISTMETDSVHDLNLVSNESTTQEVMNHPDFTSYTTQHVTSWAEFQERLESIIEACESGVQSSGESSQASQSDNEGLYPPGLKSGSKKLKKDLGDLVLSDRDPWTQYVIYKTSSLENSHNCYKWLVNLAAKHVGMEPRHLHNFIQTLELVYLPLATKKQSSMKNKPAAWFFRKSYFQLN